MTTNHIAFPIYLIIDDKFMPGEERLLERKLKLLVGSLQQEPISAIKLFLSVIGLGRNSGFQIPLSKALENQEIHIVHNSCMPTLSLSDGVNKVNSCIVKDILCLKAKQYAVIRPLVIMLLTKKHEDSWIGHWEGNVHVSNPQRPRGIIIGSKHTDLSKLKIGEASTFEIHSSAAPIDILFDLLANLQRAMIAGGGKYLQIEIGLPDGIARLGS